MSPYVFDADLYRVSAEIIDIRERLIVQQLDESWNQVTATEDAELVVRAAAAHRSGDQAAIGRILRRAAELDNANRFGPRVVDQVYAVTRDAA